MIGLVEYVGAQETDDEDDFGISFHIFIKLTCQN